MTDNFKWCLCGNVNQEGTKHFVGGAKLYCLPQIWGDGYEKIRVIGHHRKSKRLVIIVMNSKLITNWKIKAVYSIKIINILLKHNGITCNEKDRVEILLYVEELRGREKATNLMT